MVIGESKIHHRPNLNITVDGHWLFLDGMKPKDRCGYVSAHLLLDNTDCLALTGLG